MSKTLRRAMLGWIRTGFEWGFGLFARRTRDLFVATDGLQAIHCVVWVRIGK